MGSIDIDDLVALGGPQKSSITRDLRDRLSELYSDNITAKILRTAADHLKENDPPHKYPEVVPQQGPFYGQYQSRDIDFWTCGFFPGCIYSLLERTIKYPNSVTLTTKHGKHLAVLRKQLEVLGSKWSDPIHGESRLTNTHDMGFIMMPHMRPRWELYGDQQALQSIITSARNLSTRFNPTIGAIRSWDEDIWSLVTSGKGRPGNFIVIVDSLCNLDLLFYAAAQSGDIRLSQIAEAHAGTLLHSHIRVEPNLSRKGFTGMLYSSNHVVNFSPSTCEIVETLTAQGYSATSTWSRGQAWAILGFAQTYMWTNNREFLHVACGLAEYFLLRMETAPSAVEVLVEAPDGTTRKTGRFVPVWDFDAPVDEFSPPLRDTSAGVIAANGLLILSQALVAEDKMLSSRSSEKLYEWGWSIGRVRCGQWENV
ncbi:hypothetical protein FSARC_11609 [Fusarium sarcochroum]|uniref:Uncharacterized protein n=1 Tax=Fusarium sarcochroum TaxID=1208366 RepID=A0A8H4TEF4_9HYPO|nr:hypothetical protein FSARC_11609 [Fusarium sarcochroum]